MVQSRGKSPPILREIMELTQVCYQTGYLKPYISKSRPPSCLESERFRKRLAPTSPVAMSSYKSMTSRVLTTAIDARGTFYVVHPNISTFYWILSSSARESPSRRRLWTSKGNTMIQPYPHQNSRKPSLVRAFRSKISCSVARFRSHTVVSHSSWGLSPYLVANLGHISLFYAQMSGSSPLFCTRY